MKRALLYLFILSFSLPLKAKAGHAAAAGELLYQWVSDSTYLVYLKLYRDCYDTSAPKAQNLCVKNRCNSYAVSYTMSVVSGNLPIGISNGSEIGHHCSSAVSACIDVSSSVSGYTEYWYETYITLPSRCNYWEFSVSAGERSLQVTNLYNLGDLWLDATLDNEHFQGDSSPSFAVKPVVFACDNTAYLYNMGSTDINKDSLAFTLENSSNSTTCSDTLGDNQDDFAYTIPDNNLFNNPLQCNNTFFYDRHNGAMSFTPSGSQTGVLNMLVESYRDGRLIGHITREITVAVRECGSSQPNLINNLNTLDNVIFIDPTFNGNYHSGGGSGSVSINPYNTRYIDKCSGDSLNFDLVVSGGNTNAALSIIDNHAISASNAIISYTGIRTDTINGHFAWRIPDNDTGFHIITFTAIDTVCSSANVEPEQTIVVPVFVHPTVHAYRDTAILNEDTASLSVIGGINYIWQTLPGGADSLSLSCTHCDRPVAFPYITTSYVVRSAEVSGCPNSDTVTVTVLPQNAPAVISGSIYNIVGNNGSKDSLQVQLIVHTTSPSDSIFAIDSVKVQRNGDSASYQFLNEPAAVYLVKAVPLGMAQFPIAPTYIDSTIYWDSARPFIYRGRGRSFDHNIFMKHYTSNNIDVGYISGKVMLQTSNNKIPLPNILIYLLNSNRQLLASTYSNADGTYSFDDLPTGSYTVYPEILGYKTIPYTPVLLSDSKLQQTDIDFIEYLLLKLIAPAPVNVSAAVNVNTFDLYPNPAKDEITIVNSSLSSTAQVVIYDVSGRSVYIQSLKFDNSIARLNLSLMPGVYLVHLTDNIGMVHIERLVIY